MAVYSHEILLRLWAQNQLTTEQAIGQILQILHDLEPRLKRLEQTLVPPRGASATTTPPSSPDSAPPSAVSRKRHSRRRAG